MHGEDRYEMVGAILWSLGSVMTPRDLSGHFVHELNHLDEDNVAALPVFVKGFYVLFDSSVLFHPFDTLSRATGTTKIPQASVLCVTEAAMVGGMWSEKTLYDSVLPGIDLQRKPFVRSHLELSRSKSPRQTSTTLTIGTIHLTKMG